MVVRLAETVKSMASSVASGISPQVTARGVISDGEPVNVRMVDGFRCTISFHRIW